VITGVLASYGVLVLTLIEERVVTLRVALWTPVTYVMSCCFTGNVNSQKNEVGIQTRLAINVFN